MTEWRPQGHWPPQSPEDWEEQFAKYRESPEFKLLRPDMVRHPAIPPATPPLPIPDAPAPCVLTTPPSRVCPQTVEEFKPIFWFEYGHRMVGRSLGLIFGLPAAYFVARGHVKRALAPALGLLFCMGGAQGLVGWWMVKSGLEEIKVGTGAPDPLPSPPCPRSCRLPRPPPVRCAARVLATRCRAPRPRAE